MPQTASNKFLYSDDMVSCVMCYDYDILSDMF